MKKTILIILSLFLFSITSAEQHNTRITISPPLVKLSNPSLKPIILSELTIDSQIISNIAISNYELVFYNPNNQILEGELVFSLFDGQNIIDYRSSKKPLGAILKHASTLFLPRGIKE